MSEPAPDANASLSSLLASAQRGDARAAGALFAALYADLRRLSQAQLARFGGAGALGATTLLHEAYLDISARDGVAFPDRGRFMAYAARAMRGIIIDFARQGQAQKRGGRFEITSLGTEVPEGAGDRPDPEELSRISDALDELAKVDTALAELVDLRFFCGFSFGEIATMRGTAERTVQRHWEKARIFLHRTIRSWTDDASEGA